MTNYWHFFETFPKTHGKNSKLKQNLKKTQAKIPKKLKNRQLQLSSVGAKVNENSIFREET